MLDIIWLKYISYLTVVIGFFFTMISLINLGKSTRLGLPDEDTVFKDVGLYKISRNPMYVGFNLFTISSILLTANMITLLAGLFSIYSYHLIIKGEEIFLEHRFGQKYLNYKQKVRRYF
jgi:protein-S-isoprenylcysteine O-methyltransferase Ste14